MSRIRIQCGDDPDEPKAHVIRGGVDFVEMWDHITEQHVWWMRELIKKDTPDIQVELGRWFTAR